MLDNPFRNFLESRVEIVIKLYQRFDLSPNQVTIAGLFLAVVAAMLTAAGAGVSAALVWWLGRLLDGTDGIYARSIGRTSELGAYLDIVCDMAAYSVMILGFYLLHPNLGTLWLIISFLYTLCITSALAMGHLELSLKHAAKDNRRLRLGAGLAEAGETGIAYTLFLLFPGAISWLVPLWIGVLIFTVVSRTLLVRQIANGL